MVAAAAAAHSAVFRRNSSVVQLFGHLSMFDFLNGLGVSPGKKRGGGSGTGRG